MSTGHRAMDKHLTMIVIRSILCYYINLHFAILFYQILTERKGIAVTSVKFLMKIQ